MKVLVIGAGVAGTAAAWAARRAGAEVVLVHDRAGASALGSGAADFDAWERARAPHELGADEAELVGALGYVAGAVPCLLATSAGLLRPARARDGALLDLAELRGRRVAVAELVRDDWDAPLLARALGETAWAKRTGTRFEPRALELDAERDLPAYDFAARFDDAAELEKLGAELARARGGADAWLLGPWLGTKPGVAEALRKRVELPLGEALSLPGGAAGARFEAARDALLSESSIQVRRARVERVSASTAVLEGGEELAVDRVVLALGGVLSGGIVLDPARPDHPGGAAFHPSLDAPVLIEVDGLPVDAVSTLHGVDLASHGVELLERVGIAVTGAAARGAPGIFVAGDAVADRPRTFLRALASGLAAGRAAAGD